MNGPGVKPYEVAVFATQQEAKNAGARLRRGRLTTPDGKIVVTPGSVQATDGLRVSGFVATPAATQHQNWPRLRDMLSRSVLKSQR